MSNRVALIDGDVLVYRSGFAGQHNVHLVYELENGNQLGSLIKEFVPSKRDKPSIKEVRAWCEENALTASGENADVTILTAIHPEPKEFVLHTVKATIGRIMDRTEADECVVYLSPNWTFRHEMATILPYKGNRKAAKPVHYHTIREYLLETWGAKICHNIEADDAIGIHARLIQKREEIGVPITCTIDKDMDQISGEHYNFATDDVYHVKPHQAWRQIFEQTLSGDSVDNIRGLFRVGPDKAMKFLAGCKTKEEMRAKVIEVYTEKGEEKTLLENARLVYILRNASEATMPPKWMEPYMALTDVPR